MIYLDLNRILIGIHCDLSFVFQTNTLKHICCVGKTLCLKQQFKRYGLVDNKCFSLKIRSNTFLAVGEGYKHENTIVSNRIVFAFV
jgi:hypothetical protein